MSHAITVNLSDQAYAALESEAREAAKSVSEVLEASVEETYAAKKPPEQSSPTMDAEKQAARARFRRFYGIIKDGKPIDNDELDAELAREYGSSHEDD